MKFFDSHAHYEDSLFDDNRYELLDSITNSDVKMILNCCSDESVFDKVIEIVNKYDFIYGSIGVHPHWSQQVSENYLEKIEQLCSNKKIVAIGEMGLDYFWKEPKEIQKKVFVDQLQLAEELSMPVIIHDRDAHKDTMDILEEFRPKGVMHRYAGSYDLLKKALDWGMYVSFNNDITHPNWIKSHYDLMMNVPLERLLVETDCPYGPIYNSERKTTNSLDVYEALKVISQYRKVSVEQLADITYNNAKRVYKLEEE